MVDVFDNEAIIGGLMMMSARADGKYKVLGILGPQDDVVFCGVTTKRPAPYLRNLIYSAKNAAVKTALFDWIREQLSSGYRPRCLLLAEVSTKKESLRYFTQYRGMLNSRLRNGKYTEGACRRMSLAHSKRDTPWSRKEIVDVSTGEVFESCRRAATNLAINARNLAEAMRNPNGRYKSMGRRFVEL